MHAWNETSTLSCLKRKISSMVFLCHENCLTLYGTYLLLQHNSRLRHTLKQKITKVPKNKYNKIYNWKSDSGKSTKPKDLPMHWFFFFSPPISRQSHYFLFHQGRVYIWKERADCSGERFNKLLKMLVQRHLLRWFACWTDLQHLTTVLTGC